jgi:ParB family chromosome partitioning protein
MPDLSVPLDRLLPPRIPMRDEDDPQAFAELVADVRTRGVLQRIIVTPDGDFYRTVAGDRRRRAAIAAGLLEVPCSVQTFTQLQELETMVVENLLRSDPPPLKAGEVFARMVEDHGLTVEEVAHRVSKSPAYVATRLRALRLPDDVKAELKEGRVSLTAALELGRCLVDADREFLLYHAIAGGATADLVRKWVAERNAWRETAGLTAPQPTTPLPGATHTAPTYICEWHRGAVDLASTISLRVCGDCYRVLQQVRDELKTEDVKAAAGAEVPVGGRTA